VYDPMTGSFVDGTLTLHEPLVALPLSGQPGGTGTWTGGFTDGGANELDHSDGGGCLDGVMFVDFELDGGTP